MKSNKIKNTKVGDDIHFYINGVEDRGIVVKMNNEYVTVFKESTQNYEDIHINDTFFVKDIMVNKEWDECSSEERFNMLQKAHAPSPRFLTKSWDQLPKEIKEVLRKNNGIETAHKETDDMNNVTRLNDEKTETTDVEKGSGGSANINKGFGGPEGKHGKPTAGKISEANPEDAPDHKQGEKHYKDTIGTMPAYGASETRGGHRGEAKEEEAGHTRASDSLQHMAQQFNKLEDVQAKDQETAASLHSQNKPDRIETRQAKEEGRKRTAENSKETQEKIRQGVSSLKAWERWLAQRQQQVLKDVYPKGTTYEVEMKRAKEKQEKEKSWEEKILELKSNVENSVHGNIGGRPNVGISTSTSFDAPKDYEGFSHDGIRSEQFKYEDEKPSVGQKLSKTKINIDGKDKPTSLAQGTGDGGNAYNTKQQNEQKQGRVANQEKDKQ